VKHPAQTESYETPKENPRCASCATGVHQNVAFYRIDTKPIIRSKLMVFFNIPPIGIARRITSIVGFMAVDDKKLPF
jgi:hypothetical protein